MKIAIIGTGYVGLVTGACFAEIKHEVTCVDIDEKKITMLSEGDIPIYEPGLDNLVKKNINNRMLSFTTSTADAVALADVVFIAVDTPPKTNGQADLSHIVEAAMQIGTSINNYKLVVNVSTAPVGTVERIGKVIEKRIQSEVEFDIASNPEFLREGSAVKDRLKPSRIVIGAKSKRAIELLKKVYEPIDAPLVITDIRTAEMIKYASNAFLATKISFVNEIAHLCESVGADVKQVAEGMGYDSRIGFEFLSAGLGYGGSCFPKDTRALDQLAFENGHNFTLLKAVIDVNHMQRIRVVQKVKKALGSLDGKTVGILGLSFKPNTDDMREAASIDIINYLKSEGAAIRVYDPVAMEKAKALLNGVKYCADPYSVCETSDVAVIVTEWDEFRNLDFKKIKALMKQPILVDGRNIFEPKAMRDLGFFYLGIGRQ